MHIEPLEHTDLPAVSRLQPAGWSDILPAHTFYLASSFCRPIKVVVGDEIVGIGTGISHGNTGWLAHVITHQNHRRKGFGRAVVDHLVAFLSNSGCESISLVATDEGLALYSKVGFEQQTQYVFLLRSEQIDDTRLSDDRVRGYQPGDEARLLSIDRSISGEERGRLLVDKIAGAQVYEDRGVVAGFYLPELGEGLVMADTVDAGTALMDVRIQNVNAAVLPIANTHGIEFLTNTGFRESKRSTRMVWGKQYPWKPDRLYNRIAGNLG